MKKLVGVVSHHEREVEELRDDPEFAIEYLRAARESLTDPEDGGASLLMLRALAETYGGLGAIAAKAGINRESLYRALSPKGNPTLKTLLAVLSALELSLAAAPRRRARKKDASRSAKTTRARKAA